MGRRFYCWRRPLGQRPPRVCAANASIHLTASRMHNVKGPGVPLIHPTLRLMFGIPDCLLALVQADGCAFPVSVTSVCCVANSSFGPGAHEDSGRMKVKDVARAVACRIRWILDCIADLGRASSREIIAWRAMWPREMRWQ